MPVRWIDLTRTTSVRLVVLYAGLFGISALALFGIIYWTATATLGDRIDQDLAMQRDALIAEAGRDNANRLASTVAAMSARPERGFRFLVQDAAGRRIAGDLPERSTWHIGYQDVELTSPKVNGGDRDATSHVFRALGELLGDDGLLVIAQDADTLDELRELILRAFGWGAGATLLLAGIGGGIMVTGVLRRIEAINLASEHVMAGDLSRRIPVRRARGKADEFDRLASNLNHMLDRIERLVESLRQVSTDVAHDLRTPLGRLRRNLETARSAVSEPRKACAVAALDRAVTEADRLLEIFAALLRIAELEGGMTRRTLAAVSLSEVVMSVVEVYEPAAEEKYQKLSNNSTPDVLIAGDRPLLTQMIANLVENAIRHAPERGSIAIELRAAELKAATAKRGPQLTIADDGPGIPRGERQKVFRRFYRLDASRATPGNGLGLSLVAAVADMHGIIVRLEDNEPCGLKVCLAFPPSELEPSYAKAVPE